MPEVSGRLDAVIISTIAARSRRHGVARGDFSRFRDSPPRGSGRLLTFQFARDAAAAPDRLPRMTELTAHGDRAPVGGSPRLRKPTRFNL